MEPQRCDTCLSWCATPPDERPDCHLYPPFHAEYIGKKIGPLAASDVGAGLTMVRFHSNSRPDGWCRQWEPRSCPEPK